MAVFTNKPNNSDSSRSEKTYDPIPDGTYNAEVVRLESKTIDLDKTPWLDKQVERGIEQMVNFGFKITDGPYKNRWFFREVPGEISDWSGCKLRLYLQELLGQNELPDGFQFDSEDSRWIGLPCRIRVKKYYSEKGKEDRNSIEDVLAATASQLSPPTPSYEDEVPF